MHDLLEGALQYELKLMLQLFIFQEQYITLSYSTVVLYSRDRYEIIGLLKLSHSIKQPCSSVSLKKASEMHQKC